MEYDTVRKEAVIYDRRAFTVYEYVKRLRKRWKIILSIGIIFVLTSIVLAFTKTPIYTAFSEVLIERNHGKTSLETSYYYYEPDFLDTQAEIIRSENVAEKVVLNLDLAKNYRDFFLRSRSESSERDAKRKEESVWRRVKAFFSDPEKNKLHPNKPVLTIPKINDEQRIANIIRSGLSVTPVLNTKIVRIAYTNTDPGIAKIVADAVVTAYMDEMLDIKLSTSNYSLKWMTEKAAEERDKLDRSERELQEFMRDNDLVTVENKLTILPQKLSEISSQLTKAETEKKELQDLLDQINAAGQNQEHIEKIPVFASDEVLKNVREKIYKASQRIQELSKKYGVKHPVMIAAKDEMRILTQEKGYEVRRISSTIESSYELAKSKTQSLQDLLNKTKSETLNLNEKFMQYSIMKREVDSNRVLYDTLQASIKQQGVTEQSQSVNIWVIKKAAIPTVPTKPNKKLYLLVGVLLGGIFGVSAAILIDSLDNTISNTKQFEEQFGLNALGGIQGLKGKERNMDTYVLYNPLSPIAESYRLIRSALLLATAEKPPRVILLTSMNKGEGKTVTAVNLARVLAQGKVKVLIVDCDLRRPRMHTLFNADNSVGLSSFLAGNIENCPVFEIADEDLCLIPSGPIPPDPAELLGTRKMHELLQSLRETFDYVLLDSPPLGVVSDSLALSQIVDGTVMVMKAGATTIESFESGLKKMRELDARVLGGVLNLVKEGELSSYQYGYATYYAKDKD